MVEKITDKVDPDVEKLAKAFVDHGGADIEIMVQPGNPNMYGTPMGPAFMVVPDAAVPLWRMYIPAAKLALELATKVLIPDAEFIGPTNGSGAHVQFTEEGNA